MSMNKGHTINWEEANVKISETGYWRRRVREAIRIQRQPNTMNLDRRMILSNIWTPALKLLTSTISIFNSHNMYAHACNHH